MRTRVWPVVGASESEKACPVVKQGSWLDFRVRVQRAAPLEMCNCKSSCLLTCFQPLSMQPLALLPRLCCGEASGVQMGAATQIIPPCMGVAVVETKQRS